jgi:hypothetical protein
VAERHETVAIFKYIPELECFVADDHYRRIADYLGLSEWNPVVWIGRLFTRDNDFGEHWFDNWDERAEIEERAFELGYDCNQLLIVAPARFQDGRDGPCHTDEFRRRFWIEALSSLRLSLGLIIDEARHLNALAAAVDVPGRIEDLEHRIANVLANRMPGSEAARFT